MRSSWWCRSAISITLLLAVIGSDAPASAQGRRPLFDDARAEAADRARGPRTRRVRIDAAAATALRDATDDRPPVVLNLFPDVQLTLIRERLELDRRGFSSWVGHADGDPRSAVALTWDGAHLSGGVVAGGLAYDLVANSDGVVTVVQRTPSAPPLELASPDAPADTAPSGAYVQDVSADGSTAVIDLLVLYTPAAQARAGGVSQIQAQLANAVAVTNTAFQRSGVNAELTAVAIQEFTYTEAGGGLSADLYAVSPGGALNADVEAMRTATGADLVALVTGRASSAGGCGIAWLGPSSSHPFSVTEQTCLYAGQWTFSHELGHNLGARHATGDSGDTTPACPSYACGYRDETIRTLMAYYAGGSATSRLLNFSSASVREPIGVGVPTGSSLHDNARRLSETAGTIAAYRASLATPLPPSPPRDFTAAVAGGSVTLSWLPPVEGGTVSGYELEAGSSPGAANLLRTGTASSPLSVANVPAGTYFVRLRSLGPGGRSAPTDDLAVTVGHCTTPGAFTLTGGVGGGVVHLAWTTPSGPGPLTYYLGAGSTPGALDRGIFAMGGARSYATPAPHGTYYVRAVAINACGLGPISNEVLLTVP